MEPPSTVTVHVFNASGRRFAGAYLKPIACAILAQHSGPGRSVELVLVDDAAMQTLNRQSRGVDEATDVLTFPAPSFPGSPWGEIVVSLDFAARQSSARGISLRDEVAYLIVHGCLHLLGYEDEADESRAEMFRQMHDWGIALGLPEQSEWTSILKGACA